MKGKGKRLISLLLAVVMVVGMIQVVSTPASAAETVVATGKLDLRQKLAAEGDSYIVLEEDTSNSDYGYHHKWRNESGSMVVKGNKVLDLNGQELAQWIVYEEYFPATTFFTITKGATLTIVDSKGGGSISAVSKRLLEYKNGFTSVNPAMKAEGRSDPPTHDLFLVDGGTLIINEGVYTAGNSEEFWVTWGREVDKSNAYVGNVNYQSSGSVVTLQDGGTFVANGGVYYGRGYTRYGSDYYANSIGRDATIETKSGGNNIFINAGEFWGMGGADIFSVNGTDRVNVRGGEYHLHYHKRLWAYDSLGYAWYYSGGRGGIGLPYIWAVNDDNPGGRLQLMMDALWDGQYWTGNDIVMGMKHDSMMIGAITDGDVIEYMPTTKGDNLPNQYLTFNGDRSVGGKYWNIRQPAIVTFDTKPYYMMTETIPDYNLRYAWTVKDDQGNLLYDTITTTNRLDLDPSWVEGLDRVNIRCSLIESGPSGVWMCRSKELYVYVSDLPLEESQLPGGEITMDVEFDPDGSGLATVTFHPTHSEVMGSGLYDQVASVEYTLTYNNYLGNKEHPKCMGGSSFRIHPGEGDTKVTLTVLVTDIYGFKHGFTKEEWVLILPEIDVSADTLRQSGGRYIITAGDTSAKLSVEGLDADHFYRWYNKTAGQQVGTDMTVSISQPGIYVYNYWNHDKTKLLVSAPVTVDFTDYSTTVSRTEDTVYLYAPDGSGKPEDSTLSIDLGASFRNPSVEWVLKSYPAGGIYGIAASSVNAAYSNGLYSAALSAFLDDSHGYVMPGEYVFQPVITHQSDSNGTRTSYGDEVTVTVRKYVDEIKLTANGQVIEDGGSITLAPGESLDFSWWIGKNSEYDTVYPFWDVTGVDEGLVTVEDGALVGGNYWGASTFESVKVTAQAPGQITVSMSVYADKEGLDPYMFDQKVTCTVNIPVSEYEVTMGEAAIGVSGINFFRVPEGALYTPEVTWLNELQNADANKKFIKGTVSKASVKLVLEEGYIVPELLEDVVLKINGETVSLDEVEDPSLVYDPITGKYSFRFTYNFGQMIPEGGTVLHNGLFKYIVPTVGQPIDGDPSDSMQVMEFVEMTTGMRVHFSGIVQVEAGADSDMDVSNDVDVDSDVTVFEEGKLYRMQINTLAGGSYVFGEDFYVTVNGEEVYNNFSFGKDSFTIFCYFTPRPLVDEILLEMEAPSAFSLPTDLDMLNDGSNLVYPSTIQWFIDANGNDQLDEGEGTPADFNADGSFKANTAYSVIVIMNIYDRDGDGIGDEVAFAEDITVMHDDETGAGPAVIDCTVTRVEGEETLIGICHTFAPTGSEDYVLVANPNELTFNVVEGFTFAEAQTFTVENLGDVTIPADQLTLFDETGGFEITRNGYEYTVRPLAENLPAEPGNYDFTIGVRYEDEAGNFAYADVAIHLYIAEGYVDLAVEPESLIFFGTEGYEEIEAQSFYILNTGNVDLDIDLHTVYVRCESPEFSVYQVGDKVTVKPVQGLTEGVYEATLLVIAAEYGIQIPVSVTLYVDPQPEYGLEIEQESVILDAVVGYGEDTCASFIIRSIGKVKLTAEDLQVMIAENAAPENYIFNDYELTDLEDGRILLKVYPKTGIAPQPGEAQFGPYYVGIDILGMDAEGVEPLTGTSGEIQFTVSWPTYELTTRPDLLVFSANKGYTDLSKTVNVFSNGTGKITQIKAAVYGANGGLSDSFTAEVDGMTVTVTPKAGLEAGVYSAVLEIKDIENRAGTTVRITFTVTDYQITVSPESFSFSCKEGDEFYFAADYTVTATDCGQPAQWTAELEGFEGKSWTGGFALSAPNGCGAEVDAGTYTGYLVISIDGTDFVKKIPITVTVREADYRMSVDPADLKFDLTEGYVPGNEGKTVTVSSIGADAVTDFVAELPDGNMAAVTISVADGESGSKIITVAPKAGLAVGTHTSKIHVYSESGKVELAIITITIQVGCRNHSGYSDWMVESEEYHVRVCGVCGKEERAAHDWTVYEVLRPEIGRHGLKRSVCDVCHHDTGVVEIPALEVCSHACMNCGGCRKAEACADTHACECAVPGDTMKHTEVEAEILEGDDDLSLVAEEVYNDGEPKEELNPYEKYVVDHLHGYMVETIYDISLRLNGGHYELPEDEEVRVRLYVGESAAKRLADGDLYLVHITGEGRVIYGTQEGQTPLTVETEGGFYTGYISFVTDSFSPFVLASVPDEEVLELTAETTATGCEVTLTSNVAVTGNLYLAVYDADGRMLSVEVISNFTFGLDGTRTFQLEYQGTAGYVRGYLIQDITFLPQSTALEAEL